MFDLFGKKRIKALEDDVRTLYTLLQHQEEKIKGDRVYDSFCSNPKLSSILSASIYHPAAVVQKEYAEITTKQVVGMILDKLRVYLKYTPGECRTIEKTPKLELRSVNKL